MHTDDKTSQSISEIQLISRLVGKEHILEGMLCTSLLKNS